MAYKRSRPGKITIRFLVSAVLILAGDTASTTRQQPEIAETSYAPAEASQRRQLHAAQPEFQPPNPAGPTLRQAARCLAGTRVVLIGNSQIRHWFFGFHEILLKVNSSDDLMDAYFRNLNMGLPSDYREREKRACPKSQRPGGDIREDCTFSAAGAFVTFIWWEATFLTPTLTDVLRHHVETARRAGQELVVVYSTGVYELIPENTLNSKTYHQGAWVQHLREEPPQLARLVHELATEYAGFHFFWKDQTRLCCNGGRLEWPDAPPDEHPLPWSDDHCISRGTDVHTVNVQSQAQSAGMVSALRAFAPEARLLLHWNETTLASCRLFADFIHHPKLFGFHMVPLLKQWPGRSGQCPA